MKKDRRNLLFLSSLIIAYNFVDIRINEIKILGNSATINNPFSLKILITLVWFYFLYRYYQFFVSNKPFGFMQTFNEKVDEYSQEVLNETLNNQELDDIKLEKPQFSTLKKHDFWSYKFTRGVQDEMG